MARRAIKLFSEIHKALYAMTGSRVFADADRMPNLLVTTTGSKSGKPRTVPLLYVETDHGYTMVASFAEAPRHRARYRNLQKNPQATAQIEKLVYAMK